jgi:hypothetical protein
MANITIVAPAVVDVYGEITNPDRFGKYHSRAARQLEIYATKSSPDPLDRDVFTNRAGGPAMVLAQQLIPIHGTHNNVRHDISVVTALGNDNNGDTLRKRLSSDLGVKLFHPPQVGRSTRRVNVYCNRDPSKAFGAYENDSHLTLNPSDLGDDSFLENQDVLILADVSDETALGFIHSYLEKNPNGSVAYCIGNSLEREAVLSDRFKEVMIAGVSMLSISGDIAEKVGSGLKEAIVDQFPRLRHLVYASRTGDCAVWDRKSGVDSTHYTINRRGSTCNPFGLQSAYTGGLIKFLASGTYSAEDAHKLTISEVQAVLGRKESFNPFGPGSLQRSSPKPAARRVRFSRSGSSALSFLLGEPIFGK